MPELSDAQRAVLAPALAREDRCIFPVTAALKGGAVGNVAKSLLRRGFIEEIPAPDHATVWRCDEDGAPLTLRITEAGAYALAGEVVGTDKREQPVLEAALIAFDVAPREQGSRQQALIALLSRPEGATIADMQLATGWQPHSVRGALSGVVAKKLGHSVVSTREAHGRVYRIQS